MSTPTPTTPTPSINLRLTKQDAELCAIALCNVIASLNNDIHAGEATSTEQTERNQAALRTALAASDAISQALAAPNDDGNKMVLQVPVAVALEGALSARIASLESAIRAADLSAPLARASVAFAQKEVNELAYLKITLNAAYN